MTICHDCEDALAVIDTEDGTPVCDECFRARDNREPPERGFEDAIAAKYPIEG